LRLVTLLATFSISFFDPIPTVDVPGYRPPELTGLSREIAGPWLRADALWYLKVATQGYAKDDGTLAFFPAFPALTWVLDRLIGNEAVAGLVAANLACLAGLILLFAFVQGLVDTKLARTTVFGAALFPTAFFFVAPYGEPMLLATGSAALFFALRGKSMASFAAGMLAALSRPFGVAIALPLAAMASQGKGWRRWIAPLGPLVGLGAWVLYAWRLTGNPAALLDIQGNWQRELSPFWETLVAGLTSWREWSETAYGSYYLFDLAATLFGLALIPLVLLSVRRYAPKRTRIGYGLAAYGIATLAVPLSLPFLPRPMLSNPRFVLALFPLFLGLAVLPGKVRIVLSGASAIGLFVATAVYLAGRPLF
jgi:hypothetical protein